jgi:predicted amidophosphoribosyltransferase
MNLYKFRGASGWGLIFARVLLGFLSAHIFDFLNHDLIVAVPAYVAPGADALTDNAQFVIATAAKIDNENWPFDTAAPPAIEKITYTESMKQKTWAQREAIAVGELRRSLSVTNRARTRNKRIIVFDDLYTTGHTLNEVARCLIREGGAKAVTGISLARQIRR